MQVNLQGPFLVKVERCRQAFWDSCLLLPDNDKDFSREVEAEKWQLLSVQNLEDEKSQNFF